MFHWSELEPSASQRGCVDAKSAPGNFPIRCVASRRPDFIQLIFIEIFYLYVTTKFHITHILLLDNFSRRECIEKKMDTKFVKWQKQNLDLL